MCVHCKIILTNPIKNSFPDGNQMRLVDSGAISHILLFSFSFFNQCHKENKDRNMLIKELLSVKCKEHHMFLCGF